MKKLLAFASLLILVAPFSAAAATFKSGDTLTLPDKINDDVYSAGQSITTTSDITGDFVGFGGTILLNGAVSQDALVAGGTVTIGAVGDDLRAAGGTLTVNKEIGGDAFVAGGTITFTPDSHGKVSLNLAGGMIIADGTVDGITQIAGGDVQLNGTFSGKTRVRADRITVNGTLAGETTLAAREIVIADGAQLKGAVRYWQQKGAISADSAIKGGSFTYDTSLAIKQSRGFGRTGFPVGAMVTIAIISLLATALVLALFVYFDKGQAEQAARTLSKKFWMSLLAGLIFYIVTPIVGLLLCVTLIGLPLGLFVLAMYGFAVYAASIQTALVLAKWIDLRRTKQFNKWMTFLIALGILVAIKLIMFIPLVGGLAVMFIVPAGLGSVILTRYEARKAARK